MAATYEPIATTTTSGSTTSVTFSSIPSTYTDLIIIADVLGAASSTDAVLRFNSDNTSNYSETVVRGDGSSAASTRYSDSYINAGRSWNSGIRYLHTIQILNYANSTTYKTAICRTNDSGSTVGSMVILWRKTPEAINSVEIKTTNTVNITAGSIFTIYGIKAA